jgi:hypothetical protein
MTKTSTVQPFQAIESSLHQPKSGDKHDFNLNQNVIESLMADTNEPQKFTNFLTTTNKIQIENDPHNIGLQTHQSNDTPKPNQATTLTAQATACFSGCPLC